MSRQADDKTPRFALAKPGRMDVGEVTEAYSPTTYVTKKIWTHCRVASARPACLKRWPGRLASRRGKAAASTSEVPGRATAGTT